MDGEDQNILESDFIDDVLAALDQDKTVHKYPSLLLIGVVVQV